MTKVSKTAIKTKVSTQTAIMVGVVALAAFGIAAYGYGFGFGVKPSVIQNVRNSAIAPERTEKVVSPCKSLEYFWPYPGKGLTNAVKKELGYGGTWIDGEMILFFRAWLKNTNISPECDIRMQRVSILSKGKISGSEYVLRLKRVFAGGVEDLSALSLVKVVDTDPNLPSEFVLSEPLIIPAGSNIEFTIRAINPKDNKTGPDIVSISPTDIVQRDSLDRMVEWGLSEPFGPTSTVVY